MHFTYNTSINTFFQLGAKCIKKYGKWSPCTKECFGDKSRIIYEEKIGKDKPGTKKLQCKKTKAEIKGCQKKAECFKDKFIPLRKGMKEKLQKMNKKRRTG